MAYAQLGLLRSGQKVLRKTRKSVQSRELFPGSSHDLSTVTSHTGWLARQVSLIFDE